LFFQFKNSYLAIHIKQFIQNANTFKNNELQTVGSV